MQERNILTPFDLKRAESTVVYAAISCLKGCFETACESNSFNIWTVNNTIAYLNKLYLPNRNLTDNGQVRKASIQIHWEKIWW